MQVRPVRIMEEVISRLVKTYLHFKSLCKRMISHIKVRHKTTVFNIKSPDCPVLTVTSKYCYVVSLVLVMLLNVGFLSAIIHCFLIMFPEGGQTRKHCFLAMFLEGGQSMKHCFLAMFPEGRHDSLK